MVTRYPPERLRHHSDRLSAISDVVFATSASTYHTADLPLGTPTCSARSRHGTWSLYAHGEQVVVVWPGGALAGAPVEVAAALGQSGGGRRDALDRAAVHAIRQFLTDPDRHDQIVWPAIPTRVWSSPATGYWLSGPTNQHGGADLAAPGGPAHSTPPRPRPTPLPNPNPEPRPARAA